MDLLAKLWTTLDDAGRATLSDALLAGPPEDSLANVEEGEREATRDRRIYDRLTVIARLANPPLTPALAQKMDELKERYPHWRSLPGEQARFGTWLETRWGPDTRFSVDDFAAMPEGELLGLLREDNDRREGLLFTWRQFVAANPRLGLNILEALAANPDPGPVDVWEYALMGIREAENAELITDHLTSLLGDMPSSLFAKPDFVRASADLLEAKSRELRDGHIPPRFWLLFDRALEAASQEPVDEPGEEVADRDWVSVAINRSLGRIATAFINALFASRPQVGAGIASELAGRATLLMSPARANHILARVIGASRVSYLFAIDPAWTSENLIPSFSWRDEEESIAAWQGYAWQARIDAQLLGVLKDNFLTLFQPERLRRMGNWTRNLAQMLMLVGVAFNADELKRDKVRDAIRAMNDDVRSDAAAWIAGYMEAGEEDNTEEDEEPIEGSPDSRWSQRVWPWLKRVWPTESSMQSVGVSEQFALAAIATDRVFPDAVKAIRNFAVPAQAYRLIHQLNTSSHPEDHPRATIELLDVFVTRDAMMLFENDLQDIVKRAGDSDPSIGDDSLYRRWADWIAQSRR